MADKEATVFVIDMGASMGETAQGRELSNLEWSMQYVWDKICAKASSFEACLTDRCLAGERQTLLALWDSARKVSSCTAPVDLKTRTTN